MGQASEAVRFQDDSGQEWTVFEAAIEGQRHLFFQSSDAFRRVRDYPRDWLDLSPEQLRLLSWRR
jgi:hypothetical protein